jgi:glycosyltransferase involved in cell wall biosynthesis
MTPIKVLVLSRSYPNNLLPQSGLWVEWLVRHMVGPCAPRVISPVPYCPPLPGLPEYTRFRRIFAQERRAGIPVYHPRIPLGPGHLLHSFEARAYFLGIRTLVRRLRPEFPFDLIHAHFSYPDGVVAAWLGRRYRVPVIVTEHAPWRPWMDQYRFVRRQTVAAASRFDGHIAVSRSVRSSIAHFTGTPERVRVIPIGVQGSLFRPAASCGPRDSNQILYVGFINFNKGIDILLKSMRLLAARCPEVNLVLVGGSFYRDTRLQEERLRRLAGDLGLGARVVFAGPRSPEEVARYMRNSALLVLPSRAESFGAVLVEALASGTPVVSTLCGGPEDIVTNEVGTLVPPGDECVLADALEQVLRDRDRYDPEKLRKYALDRFAWEIVARSTVDVYHEALHAGTTREPIASRASVGACAPSTFATSWMASSRPSRPGDRDNETSWEVRNRPAAP